ncbi:MAG: hypothetical protein ABEJ83_02795 [Candidatus Nanohaloarchaea archaeon]
MAKGASQIATMALYIGITVAAISGAVTVGAPALENMQEASSIKKAREFMQTLDTKIQEVASEGKGSTRTISASFDRGRLYFQNATDSAIYALRTDANVISPQTSKRFGNVILSSNANVKVNKTTVNGKDCYMMENEHIKACIKAVGNQSNPQPINTSELLVKYTFKNPNGANKDLNGNISVMLNGKPSTSYGTGFTYPEKTGEFIGTGRVTATITSDYGFKYDVIIALPTGADFLKVDVQNFR